MRAGVPDRLLKIVDDIAVEGSVRVTRLTILKAWFGQRHGRVAAVARFIACRAIARAGAADAEANSLLGEADALLLPLPDVAPSLSDADRLGAWDLYRRCRAYQSETRNVSWTTVRTITCWSLLLAEEGLRLLLLADPHPADGYRLVADYCRNYEPGCMWELTPKSRERIDELARFLRSIELRETEAS